MEEVRSVRLTKEQIEQIDYFRSVLTEEVTGQEISQSGFIRGLVVRGIEAVRPMVTARTSNLEAQEIISNIQAAGNPLENG